MTWPTRASLCLDCRTTVPAGEPCRAGSQHRVRALRGAGREQLLHEVWGRPARRRRRHALDKADATGDTTNALETVVDRAISVSAHSGRLMAAVLVLGFVFVAAWWLVLETAGYVRRRLARLEPHGALAAPAAVPPRAGRAGTVAGNAAPSPLSGQPCVGFAAVLTHGRRAVVLRDAATIGFDLVLDDGARVRIPAGPIIVDAGRPTPVWPAEDQRDRYLRAVDPARATADDLDPFPHDRVEEALIRPGDRIEIVGPLRAIVDGDAPATGYREAAATLLVPDGTPRLRRLAP